jgi:replicative DNA helicase
MGTSVEIDETPSLTLQQIEARAERVHMRRAVSMVVVDHIHIMGRPRKNDVSELGEISAGLKRLAKRLKVPVIGLAQLNRANTDRPNKRPTMADLRGSGDIEQDADVILLAHREDYYRQQGEPRDHLLELIVAKNRGGKSGMTINLRERFDQMRADDWEGMLPEREPPKTGGKKMGRFPK